MLRASLGVGVGWIGISMLADGIPTVLLPHRLLADGQSDATTLGITTFAALAAVAALQPIGGRLSDAVGRAPVTASGTLIAIGGLGLMGVPNAAIPGAMVALIGGGLAQAGYQALLVTRITAAWRGRAAGLKNAFDVGGALLAFVILAMLLASGAAAAALAILATALVAGFVAAAALLRGVPDRVDRPPARAAISVPRPFLAIVIARFTFLLGIYVLGRFLLLLVADRLALGPDAAAAAAGSVLGLLALLTVATSLPSGWLADRLGRGSMLMGGGLLAGFGIAAVAAVDSMPALLGAGALVAVGSAAFGSASWAMLADVAPASEAGWLLGLANIGTAAAAALAGAFGLVIDGAGFGPAFATAAACAVGGGVIAWSTARRAPEMSEVGLAVEVPG